MNQNPLDDLIIQFLLRYALAQRKENAWYGYVSVLLTQQLNDNGQRCATAVVPQLALSTEIVDEDDEDTDEEDEDLSVILSSSPDQLNLFLPSPKAPVPKTHTNRFRAQSVYSNSSTQQSVSQGSIKKLRGFLSSRIPDFVRLRLYKQYLTYRLDLLVEIKRLPRHNKDRFHLQTLAERQIFDQAHHAFSADPRLAVLGGICGLGYEWMYTEIERPEDLRKIFQKDPTYEPSSSPRTSDSGPSQASSSPNSSEKPPYPPNDITEVTVVQEEYLCFSSSKLAQHKKWLQIVRNRLEVLDSSRLAEEYGTGAPKLG